MLQYVTREDFVRELTRDILDAGRKEHDTQDPVRKRYYRQLCIQLKLWKQEIELTWDKL